MKYYGRGTVYYTSEKQTDICIFTTTALFRSERKTKKCKSRKLCFCSPVINKLLIYILRVEHFFIRNNVLRFPQQSWIVCNFVIKGNRSCIYAWLTLELCSHGCTTPMSNAIFRMPHTKVWIASCKNIVLALFNIIEPDHSDQNDQIRRLIFKFTNFTFDFTHDRNYCTIKATLFFFE